MRKLNIICLLLLAGGLRAQDYQAQIYQAYLEGRMDTWKIVIDRMEADYNATGDHALLYDLTEAQYGYIAYCLSVKQKKEAEALLIKAEKQIQLLLKIQEENPRVYSLQGAFYGFRVLLEPFRAPVYGKRSAEANQLALKWGPREPQAWMEKANIEYYKPAIFGGSKRDAVPLYEKAVDLYEASPERTKQNWLYLNCLAGLGIAYESTDQIQKAGEIFQKCLTLAPTFKWVRDELYPGYQQKQSQN